MNVKTFKTAESYEIFMSNYYVQVISLVEFKGELVLTYKSTIK